MDIFGLVLGFFEIIALVIFVIFLSLGTALDRRDNESFKWWVLFVGVVVLALLNLGSFSLAGIWQSLTSVDLWKAVGLYTAIGLGYSMVEFFLYVRKAANATSNAWSDFMKRSDVWSFYEGGPRVPEALADRVDASRKLKATTGEMFKHGGEQERTDIANQFALHYYSRNRSLIKIKSNSGNPIPVVDRAELASYIGAWTTFWPFYAISLILGDLLEEVWNVIANVVAKISGRFVRMAFADVFKV